MIPGGGGDPWEWHRLVPELKSRGHDAIPVRLPAADDAAGWSEYASAAVEAVSGQDDVIVVGASMGGFTAPIVCAMRPVRLLVLVNAMIPVTGETFHSWGANTDYGSERRAYHISLGLTPNAMDDDAVIYYHDFPVELRAEAQSRTWQHQSEAVLEEPWPLTAWPDVQTRVLSGRHDRLFPLEFQRRIAHERLGVDVDPVGAGHMMALSNPSSLADWLESYATEARAPAFRKDRL